MSTKNNYRSLEPKYCKSHHKYNIRANIWDHFGHMMCICAGLIGLKSENMYATAASSKIHGGQEVQEHSKKTQSAPAIGLWVPRLAHV